MDETRDRPHLNLVDMHPNSFSDLERQFPSRNGHSGYTPVDCPDLTNALVEISVGRAFVGPT